MVNPPPYRRLLITLALVVMLIAAAVPSVSAYDDAFDIDVDTLKSYDSQHLTPIGVFSTVTDRRIHFADISKYDSPVIFYHQSAGWNTAYIDNDSISYGHTPVQITSSTGQDIGDGDLYYNLQYNTDNSIRSIVIFVEIKSWNIGSLSGPTYVNLIYNSNAINGLTFSPYNVPRWYESEGTPYQSEWDFGFGVQTHYNLLGYYTAMYGERFANRLEITYGSAYSDVSIIRNPHGTAYASQVILSSPDVVYYNSWGIDNEIARVYGTGDVSASVRSPKGTWYNQTFGSEPGDQPVLRKGSVTMTDNNGTKITGFEVTAINAYTGQSYTVVTESDVAVMNVLMDRSIRLRNPQTGEYEESVVGYYRFYGQAPGYKMLNEDGIRVSVVPEKYSSYELCNIGVTSESGYLTGKHLFQIRSRSDNTVLQTGTLSAKSATTGEWYNTTVSGGIATLILPYDTSNTQSQYAGNYYVYGTSPGYEDSDYGTQIVVMPHTVSEIKDILLTPIGGIPTPGNVTLRIQAFSEDGPGVVNAEIFIAGVLGEGSSVWDTYTASSTGYLAVSVPGNSTYDIVASGAGYYDSARRVEVLTEDPPLIEIKLYLSGAPTLEPTTQPTGWPTTQPTGQPTGGIPDEDDDSEGFLMQAVRGIGLAFGVGFATAKLIFGMLLALSIGYATAKQLRGGAAEFGLGLVGGTLLGILIGLLPVWIIVVLLLVVGLYIGNRYVGGGNNG